MPEIGRPNIEAPNSFSEVKMAVRPSPQNKKGDSSVGEKLNKMAGNNKSGDSVQFVDRKTHNQIGQNEFMKLLTVQLAHQDPMNPVDQQKLSGDLAQFSQLEQLTNMNSKLDKLGGNAAPELKYYGASFIGKKIVTKGTTIDYKGEGTSARIPFNLPEKAKNVIVRITDDKGQMVGQIEAKDLPAGPNMVTWDGKAMDSHSAGKGFFNVSVFAFDETGNKFNGQTKSEGLVTGVHFDEGETVLEIDSKKNVFLRDVESFSMAEAAPVLQNSKATTAKAYQGQAEAAQQ